MKFSKIFLVAIVLAACAFPGHALATSFGFYKITSNGNENVASQLFVDVTDAGNGAVSFKFTNAVGIASSITDVYFADGTLLGISNITTSGLGVSFDHPANPGDLPSGNNVGFVTTAGFSADSDPPALPNGVNAANEWLTITFSLQAGQTYADTLAALNSGALCIGLHVQGIGTTGGSDSFVNKVPEPGTLLLIGSGLIGLAAFRKRFKKE